MCRLEQYKYDKYNKIPQLLRSRDWNKLLRFGNDNIICFERLI